MKLARQASIALLAALVCGGSCTQTGQAVRPPDPTPREVIVRSVEQVDLVKLDGDVDLRLSGVEETANPVADDAKKKEARERLAAEIVGKKFLLRPDPARPVSPGELRGELWENKGAGPMESVSERLLRRGDAMLDLTRGPSAGDERFRKIATEAAAPRSRRVAVPLGFQGGIVLPLYSKEQGHDYGPRLKEIKEAGATWVSLLFVWFMDKMDGHLMAPKRNQKHWEDNRTAPDEAIAQTVRQAKELGLRVLLLPVVLPWKPGPDDWRGSLRPVNRAGFFENYARFLLRYADLAEQLNVDAFSIGSELISLENKVGPDEPSGYAGDTAWWRRIARSVRARFGGRLTYSANWDHYDVLGIIDELDFVGLTAYYSLTKNKDASVEEMVEAWKPIQESLRADSQRLQRPFVFTEVGYASLKGINTDPWNYKMDEPLDLECQVRCYKAFAKAFDSPDFLVGAYFFDWYDNGGPTSTSYSPRGKPAEQVMREYLKHTQTLPKPLLDPAK